MAALDAAETPARIVVTGAGGFLGRHVISALALRSPRSALVLVDLADPAASLPASARPLRGDLSDDDVIAAVEADRPSLVVHLAAVSDTRHPDPGFMLRRNVRDFRRMLDLAARCGARVVYASSAAVYGNGPLPMRETQAPQPMGAYAASKLLMERLAARQSLKHGVSALGLRFFNLFGPGEAHKGRTSSVVHKICAAIHSHETVRIYRPGTQRRDFVYIGDGAEAVAAAALTSGTGVVNVGSGTATRLNDVIGLVGELLGRRPSVEYLDAPTGTYQEQTLADTELSRSILGFSTAVAFSEGVELLLQSLDEADAHSAGAGAVRARARPNA